MDSTSQISYKKGFSPNSCTERPMSPFGGIRSTAPGPKITFTYKNPLKYSYALPEKS